MVTSGSTHARMILDVGCGSKPKGDVNVDLYTGISPHIYYRHLIDPKHIPNFVRADAEYLPFKSDSFDLVYASELLEHTFRPYEVLAEFRRVSSRMVFITVPCLKGWAVWEKEQEGHNYTWSEDSLRQLLGHHFRKVEIHHKYQKIRGRLLRKLPFSDLLIRMTQKLVPIGLKAICEK
jgi:ubiquinone/menaquinone biosynthesis C-methylase UbiE